MSGAQQAALSWRYLLAIVYDDGGYGEKLAYFAIDFGTAAATTEERVGGTPYDPSVTTLHGVVGCTPDHIVHYAKATSDVAAGKGTVFGHDSAPDMQSGARKTFGFTDASEHANGQLLGVDDYQDGSSCGDVWVPQAVRGKRMVVLVK